MKKLIIMLTLSLFLTGNVFAQGGTCTGAGCDFGTTDIWTNPNSGVTTINPGNGQMPVQCWTNPNTGVTSCN